MNCCRQWSRAGRHRGGRADRHAERAADRRLRRRPGPTSTRSWSPGLARRRSRAWTIWRARRCSFASRAVFYDSLAALNAKLEGQGQSRIVIKEAPETLEDDDVLEMVNAGLVKITVVDNHMAEFWKQLLPPGAASRRRCPHAAATLAVAMRKNSPQLMARVHRLDQEARPAHHVRQHDDAALSRRARSSRRARRGRRSSKRFEQMVEFFRKYGEQYRLDYLADGGSGLSGVRSRPQLSRAGSARLGSCR